MIKEVLTKKPAYKVGSRFLYSNCSVSIAGVMLEKAAGKSWEELIQEKIAEPLNIKSLGFGDAAITSAVDQPYNHTIRGGKAVSLSPMKRFDNSPAIAPAGTVHLSVLDFAKYTDLYAHSGKGLLKLKTFEEIVKVRKDDYALGWYNVYRKWGGHVLNHNGSNTMNFATMWISPNKTFSIVLVTNCYGSQVPKAIDEVCWSIIQKHL